MEEGGDRHRHETMVTTRRQAAGVVGGADEKAGGRSGAKRGGAAKRTGKADGSAVQYEFFGPTVGPLGIVVGLPAVMYALCGFCGSHGCVSLSPLKIPTFNVGTSLFSFEGFAVYLGWIFAVVSPPVPVGRAPLKSPRRTLSSRLTPNLSPLPTPSPSPSPSPPCSCCALCQAVLHLCLPSVTKLGVGLPDGSRLKYRMNGLLVYAVILSLLCALVSDWDFVDRLGLSKSMLGYAYDHYVELLSASVASTLLFSVILYLASHRSRSVLCAQGGNTGSRIYDFFIGRELNPRLGRFDLKEFCELYPGLIGWVVIDLAMAYKQYELHGAVSNSMAMVCLFHAIYVADALYFEKSILTTMDIVHDGFGFMLAFGDLAWVPFTYSLQARYLVDHPIQLSNSFAALVLVMKTVGYLAFRGANGQKDRFRRDPNSPQVKHVKYIKTQRGTKLMISGWWGIARHINYTADWLMGLSWCLCCGFDHVIPYFYAIYFGVLLVHRDLRDGEACEKKYGKDWDKYCSVVRYRLIPFVY